MNLAGSLIFSIFLQIAPADVVLDQPVPRYRIGKPFHQTLSKTISGSWKNVTLRAILRRISDQYEIAILLDRRIDPTQVPNVNLKQQTLEEGLRQLADQLSARVSIVGNTVFIGPPRSTAKLRTLIRLRYDELDPLTQGAAKGREFDLIRKSTFHWDNLETPADVLDRIASQSRLSLKESERIPHDLWAAGTLPNANVLEAVSLVLIQFDLTFQWTESAAGIRLVPVSDEVTLEQFYPSRRMASRMSPGKAAQKCLQAVPGITAVAEQGGILVRGTVEQHEAVRSLLRPRTARRNARAGKVAPLSRRQMSLKLRNVRAVNLLEKLQEEGVIVVYDPAALERAGIDLNQRISIDVEKATAEQFFKAICDPLGLRFTIDNVTVRLSPK